MKVVFDLWVLNENHEKGYTVEQELMFKTFYEFIYDRLVYLWNEIEAEEKDKPNGSICIMVELLKKIISFHGYSESLTEKLKGSFNERDGALLAQRFDEAFNYLN